MKRLLAAAAFVALAHCPGLPATTPVAHARDASPMPALPLGLMAARLSTLDAVLDIRRPDVEGITVLAITPGGNADRMGMQLGDRVLAVNGRSLTDTLRPSAVLENALTASGPITATVSRQGKTIHLVEGTDANPILPDPVGCGYITNRGTLPTGRGDLFPVEILSIDGGGQPIDANRFRLSAGMHAIIVSERIDDIPGVRFNLAQRRERNWYLDREGHYPAKTVLVDVKPNTRHRIGALFIEEGLKGKRVRENAYWEPVVWEDVPDDCD
jgi:hypothetical protein